MGIDRVALLETVIKEIRLPQDLYDMYRKEMEKDYGHLPGGRMGWNERKGVANGDIFENKGIASIADFPTFDIHIPGAILRIPPELYFMTETINGSDLYFLQIIPNKFMVLEMNMSDMSRILFK